MLHFRLHGGESATPEEIKEFCKGQVDYEVNLILKRFFFLFGLPHIYVA